MLLKVAILVHQVDLFHSVVQKKKINSAVIKAPIENVKKALLNTPTVEPNLPLIADCIASKVPPIKDNKIIKLIITFSP